MSEQKSEDKGAAGAVLSVTWANTTKINLVCRACGASGVMPHVVTVPHFHAGYGDVEFYGCSDCGSLNTVTNEYVDYTDEDVPASLWAHYFHCGAGIDSITGLLEIVGIKKGSSLLDVGCGVGFSLDYWRQMGGGEAVGLEASEYGELGCRLLDVTIYPKYLNEAEEIRGHRYDRIISSEVIEHVDDPTSFLAKIREHLSEDGVLVITTPNADFVNERNSLSVVLSVLSPGLHRVLFSQEALSRLLEKVGFSYYDVRIERERLVAYASNVPLMLSEGNGRARYIEYLEKRLRTSDDSMFGLGLDYRAFKEFVNDGHFEKALPFGEKIVTTIKNEFGIDLTSKEFCQNVLGQCATLDEYFRVAPFFLPGFVFYMAMASRQGYPIGAMEAADGFACAAALCEDVQRIMPLFSQEAASLYWPSVYEEGNARLQAGDRPAALELFERIQQGPADGQPYLAYTLRDERLIIRAMVQSGVAVLQMGNPEEAMAIFRRAMSQPITGSAGDIGRDTLALWLTAKEQAEDMFIRLVDDKAK